MFPDARQHQKRFRSRRAFHFPKADFRNCLQHAVGFTADRAPQRGQLNAPNAGRRRASGPGRRGGRQNPFAAVQHTSSLAGLADRLNYLRMPDNSFDVVSEIQMPEVINAIQQSMKEITTRFDLKDSKSTIELNEKDKKVTLASADDFKLKAISDILQNKMVKRGVPIRNLEWGKLIPSAGMSVRQEVTLVSGIPIEKARDIVKKIKDGKVKVQASINGDVVRVSGKDRDTLQQVMALLRGADFGIELQFTNFRTN